MSVSCTDKDTLVAYVYGECDAATGDAVEAHLSTCPACADEVGGFGRVRTALAEWTPPNRVGSFRLVRDESPAAPAPARVLRPARWWQAPLPALLKVAAAVLLFAGGAALANLEVRYDKDGFAVRTGWQKPESSASREATGLPVSTVAPAAPASAVVPASLTGRDQAGAPWQAEMATFERQMRDEFRQQLSAVRTVSAGASPVGVSAGTDASERRILANVQAMIDDSAQRQQLWTAYRINQVVGEFQAQWRADLVRVQQTGGTVPAPAGPRQPQMQPQMRNLFPVTLKK
jgi:anti-sigma factor RsiW